MDDIHLLVLKVAGKLVPVPIGGMAADVKFLVNRLRDSEECGGWLYIMTSFFFIRQSVTRPIGSSRGFSASVSQTSLG